jgi:hypothetical protein
MISIWRKWKYFCRIGGILLVSILIISTSSLVWSISSLSFIRRIIYFPLSSLNRSISSLFFIRRIISFPLSSFNRSISSLYFIRRIIWSFFPSFITWFPLLFIHISNYLLKIRSRKVLSPSLFLSLFKTSCQLVSPILQTLMEAYQLPLFDSGVE